MNDSSAKVKQQLVEKIKDSTNILVTVGKNPDVDALSAALGLTAMLNKLDKHSTAIFSGSIPPAISFLEPDKVFEDSADSLRDFIIALDKEKADHLRYKVEGDVVKIFITPYRTTISSDDLQFSQGDYNVELVLALGVADQADLDVALSAHQMLDNVTIITFSAGKATSNLGSVDWHSPTASCLCEMVAALAETSKKEDSLLDKQIATALLTGIVAATERFSNDRTNSQVMTVAAQLMAAGADQQLIASKLQDAHAITSLPTPTNKKKATESAEPVASLTATRTNDGSLSIEHEGQGKVPTINEILAKKEADTVRGDQISSDMAKQISPFDVETTIPPDSEQILGGTLNATAAQAEEDSRRELVADRNRKILSHAYLGGSDDEPVINANAQAVAEDQPIDIFAEPASSEVEEPLKETESIPTIEPLSEEPIEAEPEQPVLEQMPPILETPEPMPEPAGLPEATYEPLPETLAQVAMDAPPAVPAPSDPSYIESPMPIEGLPLPPEIPDFSTLPPVPPTVEPVPVTDSGVVAPPPMPEMPVEQPPESTLAPVATADNPGQFKIPGQ